ncbi:PD-(D/E)XK nuclease family protein [Daejeonella sp.]|uniref:PD-(D/E)XK nuclease family protein n=1 Tax=Daejeonella sp. TaxID=2805397 RepID=UPI0025C439C9|nr:PD-(D/E)XK nuclease family protein [Daejeonella sp.]
MNSKSTDKFLHRLALDLLDRFGNDLQHVAIVFNNKRPQLFLKKYLAEISGKPIWSPHFFTIQQFFAASTSQVAASQLKQFFILLSEYNLLLAQEGKEQVSADVFYPLAEIIVSDFSQIDYYMANPDKVFSLIGSIAELEQQFPNFDKEQLEFMESFWASFSQEKQSQIQEKFIEMWHRMPRLYINFHKRLAEQNLVTSAKMYRNLAEGKDSDSNFLKKFKHVVFAGFNALSKAEEVLFKNWHDEGLCSFYFDADEHYFSDPIQEAGHFIRRNIGTIGLENQFKIEENRINSTEKEFTVIQAMGQVAQGKILKQVLAGHENNHEVDSKAIILADESLLLPVLQTVDDDSLNITMGYPFEQSAVFGICDLWLKIQDEIAGGDKTSISYPQVLNFILNPLIGVSEENRSRIHKEIIDEKKARFRLEELKKLDKIAEMAFSPYENPVQSIRNLGSFLLLISKEIADLRKLESLLISEAVKNLNILSDSFEELAKSNSNNEIKATFLFKLIRRALSGLSVPFDGEPLVGLQVMGLLESRCLDFDELVVLGMNEGVLPKVSITPSFIPDNVRRAFGLPVLENQNSIFAYFFYRLLHCAQKITLVYNGVEGDTAPSEVSRFIKQLEFETSCKFKYVLQQNQPIENTPNQEIIVEKKGLVLEKLRKYLQRNSNPKFENRISASGFNDYLSCSLKFFYGKIAKLKKPEELPDHIGANTVGSMLHDVMEHFYRDSIGIEVSAEYIAQRKKLVSRMCQDAMSKTLNLDPSLDTLQLSALQQIILRVIEQYALKILEHDARIAPFVIKELEEKEKYAPLFSFDLNGKEEQVRLLGIIDRVDSIKGKTRIVDYKTGKDSLAFKDFESLFSDDVKSQNKALVQTLFYTLVYEKFNHVDGVEPHLYTVKDFSNGTIFNRKSKSEVFELTDENLTEYKSQLELKMKEKFSELFNPEIPFRQTDNLDSCKYCNFRGICQR